MEQTKKTPTRIALPGYRVVPVAADDHIVHAAFEGKLESQDLPGQIQRRKAMAANYEAMVARAEEGVVEIDAAVIERIRARYAPAVIPPCRVCGEALSLQKFGGGEPAVYACSKARSGSNMDWVHYNQSSFTDRHGPGDADVISLLDAVLGVQKAEA